MAKEQPEQKKFNKNKDKDSKAEDINKDAVGNPTVSEPEEDEFEAEVLEAFTSEEAEGLKILKDKHKGSTFLSGYLSMKIINSDLPLDVLKAVTSEIEDPAKDIITKLSSGMIKLGVVPKEINDIIVTKTKSHKKLDLEELAKIENIKNEEKEILNLEKKIMKIDTTAELFNKKKTLDKEKLSELELKAIDYKLNEFVKEKKKITDRLSYLKNAVKLMKQNLAEKRKRDPEVIKAEKEKFIEKYKEDTDAIQEKISEWKKNNQEIKDKHKRLIEKLQEEREKIIEEKKAENAENEAKRKQNLEEMRKLMSERNEKWHSEIENLKVPPTVKKEDLFLKHQKAQLKKDFQEKEEKEREVQRLKKIKKLRVPTQEELELFSEEIENKQKELLEALEQKKAEERKRLFGDEANKEPVVDEENMEEAYQNYFYSKLMEEQKLLEDEIKFKAEEKKKRIEKRKNYIETIKLPEINQRKAKEMIDLKTKSRGMHLHNPYDNGKYFKKRNRTLKAINNKVNKIRQQIQLNISRRSANNSNSPIKTKSPLGGKNYLYESSKFQASFLNKGNKSVHFGNISPLKPNNSNDNIITHIEGDKSNMHKSRIEALLSIDTGRSPRARIFVNRNHGKFARRPDYPIRSPVDIRVPMLKYPNYLEQFKKKAKHENIDEETFGDMDRIGVSKYDTSIVKLKVDEKKHIDNQKEVINSIYNLKESVSRLEDTAKIKSKILKISGGPANNPSKGEELGDCLVKIVKKKLELLDYLKKEEKVEEK